MLIKTRGVLQLRLVSFEAGRRRSYGILSEGRILDLPAASAGEKDVFSQDIVDFIAAGQPAIQAASRLLAKASPAEFVSLDQVRLLAPIAVPRKNIFCVGRNYSEHVIEGFRAVDRDVQLPAYPQFFTKAPTAVLAPDGQFRTDPAITEKYDYEIELAVVIGKRGRDIARQDALDHVFGVTILNDITARDLQRRHDQWFKGKSLDGSAPMGPCIVTLDEIGPLDALELVARVNGEERQRGSVAQMIFDIPEIIAQLSAGLTLEPGDVIATGTPSGVGYAMDPPRFLAPGDVVDCAIDGIGLLTTYIVGPGDRP
jgi:2-keto-4-pentenoate hydratase/2-oxohepta-3-ene-1,7-dioic acid hydratase in catechol pathway